MVIDLPFALTAGLDVCDGVVLQSMIVRPAINMAGKKKLDFGGGSGAGSSTRTPSSSDAPSAMETMLDESLNGMKVNMAQRILANDSSRTEKKDKKKKKSKKKKSSSSSSSEPAEHDSPEFLQELALQLSLKPKHLRLKDLLKYEDLAADARLFLHFNVHVHQ